MKYVETAIRHLIEAWASTVRARDISGVIAYRTDDVLMFDVPPPVALHGIAAYRETWSPFFDALAEGEAAFDIAELECHAWG
jgi:ketosteroid isomerase-like protein